MIIDKSSGRSFMMNEFGSRSVNDAVTCIMCAKAEIRIIVRHRKFSLVKPAETNVERSGNKETCAVKFADYLDTAALVKRASELPDRDPGNVPFITYVLRETRLADIEERFDVIVSCHCIEHQPDILSHLHDVFRLLEKGGSYVCLLPDKRCCFDYFIPESELPEILAAYHEKRRRPTLRSVIEHRAFTRHDFMDGPQNPFKDPDSDTRKHIDNAVAEFTATDYVDVHCWYFTSTSIRKFINALKSLGYIADTVEYSVYNLGSEIALILCSR
jgi:SAM-dependent methyltransferase